jgi:hypothetical protein
MVPNEIQSAERVGGLRDNIACLVIITKVGRYANCPSSAIDNFLRNGIRRIGVQVDDGNRGTLARES